MKEYALLLLFLVALGICAPVASAQRIVYVNHAASGANDGGSWEDAFSSLQDALAAATSGDEIWVAAGTYRPDQGADITEGDREATFFLENELEIYGGFNGTEGTREERNWEINRTTLSGDLLNNDTENVGIKEPTRLDNNFRVVMIDHGSTITLDGFTITGGHADNTSIGNLRYGGGMAIDDSSQVHLSHLIFEANIADKCGGAIASYTNELVIEHTLFYKNLAVDDDGFCGGGALYHFPGFGDELRNLARLNEVRFEENKSTVGGAMTVLDATIIMTGGVFVANHADVAAGAVFNRHIRGKEKAVYANVAFFGNSTNEQGGGAMFNEESNVKILNAVFSGNTFTAMGQFTSGGAIANIEFSDVEIINTTFSGNSAPRGGAIYNGNSDLVLWNSILSGNRSDEAEGESIRNFGVFSLQVGHSIVQGGIPEGAVDEGGNLEIDPLFVDADGLDGIAGTEDDNLRLQDASAAIDAGNNSALPQDTLDLDQDGNLMEDIPLDLDGNVRVFGGGSEPVVDIGAYENLTAIVNTVEDERSGDMEVCTCCGLSDPYPNPATSRSTLMLCLSDPEFVQVGLFDILGRRIDVLYTGTPTIYHRYSLVIDRGILPKGLYFVRVFGKDTNTAKKLFFVL